jgi:tripartite-type tricarboxylate transporter receptor subunit TctC
MESGFPSLNILTWVGLLAPKDTPSLIVDAIAASASRVLSSSNVKSRLNENGLTPTSVTPAQFQSIIVEESNGWKKAF